MSNKAQEIITPNEPGIFRVLFLYVGQGDSTLLVLPFGEEYKYMLVDCNKDSSCGGIDLPALLKDLTDTLHYFVNTHPHKDHIRGIGDIDDAVEIKEIWHSGHTPGGKHKESYEEFKKVMDSLDEENVIKLKGTRDELEIGDVTYNVLAPAEYVSDEIDDEDPDTRYARIHEQCAVLRFKYGEDEKRVLLPGDADLDAWQKHILGPNEYHKERLPSTVLSAVHHGSRSFFKKNKDDEPYEEHLKAIDASYLVISAPKQEESEHGHPHDDALEIYRKYFDEDCILHLGENRECVIVDIRQDGSIEVRLDKELVDVYGTESDDNDNGGNQKSKGAATVFTRLDSKSMGTL